MSNILNPMADIYHSQLEASRRFAEVLFSGTERLDHVVIEATHRAFTNNLNLAHAAVSLRDPKELANMQSNMLAQRPDSAMNFQKEMMRVFAEIQNEMGKSMKEYVEKFGNNVARSATAPLKSVQDRTTEAIFNPLTGMFSLWESAFREVASMTNKNISAASAGVQRAAEDVLQTSVRVTEASVGAASDVAAAAMPERGQADRMQAAAQQGSQQAAQPNGANGSRSEAAGGDTQQEPHAERHVVRHTERQAERATPRAEHEESHDERRPHGTAARRK